MDQGKGRGGPLLAGDVESIERATVAAVSPHALEEIDGWLLPFDGAP